VLVWNGDTPAVAFNLPADPPRVLLKQDWASTRQLLFVPGNHDVRGACARDIRDCLAAGPEAALPYNVAWRYGPLALLTLDTGEDKPDAHPVFAGTAAYEPYRARQAAWLREALTRPEIASAPFKVAFCHIPLHGLPKQNDGLSLKDYAEWSGDGARKWMPALCKL
jgi:3',5'-cyclic AMP phosphodiesterase CpdA